MQDKHKLPKYHSFNGVRYRLRWRKPRKNRGICYDPSESSADRIMGIDPNQSNVDVAETLLHEGLHAELWCLDEPSVSRIAENLTKLLERCNLINTGR